MIIVEGCDNSGKSTLIQEMAETLKLAIARSYGRPRSLNDILNYQYWLAQCPQPLIIDRHPAISDLVYGPIIRHHTPAILQDAQELASLNTTYLVYCRPPYATMTSSLTTRPQMDGVLTQFSALSKAYDELMDTLQPHFTYDFTQPHHFEELVNDYRQFAERNL